MKNRKFLHIGIIILAALFLGFFDLPAETQSKLVPFAPEQITQSKIHLGLDLQGGAQLDYKIDLRNVPEDQKKNIVDGILSIINKRVNNLGVSEPNIYTSDIGEEKHILVELAGIQDLEEAKTIVGKTIQLEFKELKENKDDPELEQKVKTQAQELLDKVIQGGDLKVLGQEEEQANPGKVFYMETEEFKYKDEVSTQIADKLFELDQGQITDSLIEDTGSYTVDASGNLVPGPKGFHILEITEKRNYDRTTEYPRGVVVRHILIGHKDAENRTEKVTRTQEEAKTRIEEVMSKIEQGEDFAELAKEYSDDPGSKENGGLYENPVTAGGEEYVKEYEDAAVALEKTGEISDIIETPFGYHILRAEEIQEARTETKTEPQIKYIDVYYSAAPDPWASTELDGRHFIRADVEFTQTMSPYISILFDDEGAKLFEELTRKNVGKPIAIFVGGQQVSAPNVNEVIAGGSAQITGQFTLEEANEMARDLNTGAIPAPITLAGQYSIGATLGQSALSSSINAGLLGLLLVIIFMILYYRLPGFIASVSLTIYAAILIFLIKVSLPIIFSLIGSVVLFAILILGIMNNRESTVEKAISAVLACFVLFFITFVLATPIVLTLAGIAGVILSIGMAVDANILIFERIKEELRDGRSLGAAIEVGFDRAWSSIRDSNFASLITCAILFYFGSSIIQGFAFNLAAGILVSMFTAITITKTFLEGASHTQMGKVLWLFGGRGKKNKKILPIISKRKFFYILSSTLILITLIGLPIFGLKLGLDFTGGTLMELKFEEQIDAKTIKSAIDESQQTINEKLTASHEEKMNEQETLQNNVSIADESTEQDATADETTDTDPKNTADTDANDQVEASPVQPTLTTEKEQVDLSKSQVVPSENRFLIKTPHISAEAHDYLIEELKIKLGAFEESRFSTVGPTVGQSLQQKAIFAVLIAAVMIVLYIALAFRRVPRYIGKWRFGVSAIIALIHDLAIMLGVYIFLGIFLNVEIDALFITAMLTVLGFSVHDTIVVFDRIREKLKYQKRDETFGDVANQALNETLARSINTSLSTLFVLGTLFFLGVASIKFFVLSLIVGIISGTYSSIFVATPILIDWQNYIRRKKENN